MAMTEMVTKKVYKFPANLAVCADKYYELQQKRYKLQNVVKLLAEEENALEEHIINKLPASKATGISGKVAQVLIDKKTILQVRDWPKFYAHILKTKSFDLLNRAPNAKAIKERCDAGKAVPGTDKYVRKTLHVHKLTKGRK